MFSLEFLKNNLKNYENLKDKCLFLEHYDEGIIDYNDIYGMDIEYFIDFHEFIKRTKSKGFSPIMENIKWSYLKQILTNHTTNQKYKTYIKNRTEKDFLNILKNPKKLDVIINGRNIKNKNLKDVSKLDGFIYCIVPIINYIIEKNLINHIDKKILLSNNDIKKDLIWYTENLLNDESLINGINSLNKTYIYYKKIENLFKKDENSLIEYKYLNLNYLSNLIKNNIMNSVLEDLNKKNKDMKLKCLRSINTNTEPHLNLELLTKNNYYNLANEPRKYSKPNFYYNHGVLFVTVECNYGLCVSKPYFNFENTSDVILYNINTILNEE